MEDSSFFLIKSASTFLPFRSKDVFTLSRAIPPVNASHFLSSNLSITHSCSVQRKQIVLDDVPFHREVLQYVQYGGLVRPNQAPR